MRSNKPNRLEKTVYPVLQDCALHLLQSTAWQSIDKHPAKPVKFVDYTSFSNTLCLNFTGVKYKSNPDKARIIQPQANHLQLPYKYR